MFGHFLLDILHIVPFAQKFKPKSPSMLKYWVSKFWKLIFSKCVIRSKNWHGIQMIDENVKFSISSFVLHQKLTIFREKTYKNRPFQKLEITPLVKSQN